MTYTSPQQSRSIESEKKFLNALEKLLVHQSFNQITIEEIAKEAGLNKSAFLKRFGNKKNALIILFSNYCEIASNVTRYFIEHINDYSSIVDIYQAMSLQLEKIQQEYFASNRGMQEFFLEDLKTHSLTKKIFIELVELNKLIQKKFKHKVTDIGAYASAQLLVTINYNYILSAMPGLPKNKKTRHELIAKICSDALII